MTYLAVFAGIMLAVQQIVELSPDRLAAFAGIAFEARAIDDMLKQVRRLVAA